MLVGQQMTIVTTSQELACQLITVAHQPVGQLIMAPLHILNLRRDPMMNVIVVIKIVSMMTLQANMIVETSEMIGKFIYHNN